MKGVEDFYLRVKALTVLYVPYSLDGNRDNFPRRDHATRGRDGNLSNRWARNLQHPKARGLVPLLCSKRRRLVWLPGWDDAL